MSARIGVQLRRPHVVDVLLERIGVGLQLCLCALFCPSDGSLDFRFDVGKPPGFGLGVFGLQMFSERDVMIFSGRWGEHPSRALALPYLNRGWVVKPLGTSNSSLRTSVGSYECSSPHSSH
jgi:hypothetical protein